MNLIFIEYFVLFSASALSVVFYQTELRWLIPDEKSFFFIFNHYLSQFFLVLVFFAAMFAFKKIRRDHLKAQFVYLARMFFLMTAATFIHFNIKLWAPVLNPLRYDEIYLKMDFYASGLSDLINFFRQTIPENLPGISNPYHTLFLLMFVFSFFFHGIQGKVSSERLVTATILILILGAFFLCCGTSVWAIYI